MTRLLLGWLVIRDLFRSPPRPQRESLGIMREFWFMAALLLIFLGAAFCGGQQ